jgi:hypothetical protein
MNIPVGMVDNIKDRLKQNYPLNLRVWTHNGQKAHWSKARIQVFKEVVYIKLFSNKQSYIAPDIKYTKVEGKIKFDAASWDAGKVIDDSSGSMIYEVYLTNDYELYPVDVRNDRTKELYLNWKNATETYQNKLRLQLPQVNFREGVTDAQKQGYMQQLQEQLNKEQGAAKDAVDLAYAEFDAWCMRDRVFFDPKLSSSATQTMANGFKAIFEYMRDNVQNQLIMWQGIAIIFVCIAFLAGAWMFYDNSQKLNLMWADHGTAMVNAMPQMIKQCIENGYVASNVSRMPGV